MARGVSEEKAAELVRLWHLYGKTSSVVALGGVTRHTAELYRPGKPADRGPVGIEKWSDDAKARWARYWDGVKEEKNGGL